MSLQNSPIRESNYISGIDGIRALAVLAVVIYHMSKHFLPGGFSGVDVFFVVSGFVVAGSLMRHSGADFGRFTVEFYARRMLRILPALLFCLVVCSLVAALFIPGSRGFLGRHIPMTGLYAVFGWSNHFLVGKTGDYFSPIMDFNPFMHTWSLGVEEQFYLVFPPLFYLWLRFSNARLKASRILSFSLASLFCLSIIYSIKQTASDPLRAYFLLPSRFWELAAGAMLFQSLQRRTLSLSAGRQSGIMWCGLALIIVGFFFSDERRFPFPYALLAVSGSLLLILGLVSARDRSAVRVPVITRLLAHPALVYFGVRSYSIYLWHWPVFVFLRWTTGFDQAWQLLLGLALTLCLAELSFRFIEQPIRRHKGIGKLPKGRVVLAGGVALALASLAILMVVKNNRQLSLSVVDRNFNDWYGTGSGLEVSQRTELGRGRKIFVLGDSHAGAYEKMLHKLASEQSAEVTVLTKGGQSYANLLRPSDSYRASGVINIEGHLKKVVELARSGDIVFLASLRVNRLCDQWEIFPMERVREEQYSPAAIEDRALALNEARGLISILQKLNVTIIIDAPKPVIRSIPYRCSDWFNRNNPIGREGFEIDRDILLEHRSPTMKSLDVLKTEFPGVIVWDPFPVLCPGPTFSAFDGDKPLLFDGDHLSGHGNRMLYPSFEALVLKLWEAPILSRDG
ncbi:MAG: acyltransferase family protein [Verrucomicrobia bacterium]|nr:acyltransferase family protein [Verrucomicrobiota bacterium]